MSDFSIWEQLCFSIIPFWFSRLFQNLYISQLHLAIAHDEKYDAKKANRYGILYLIFLVLSLPLALLFWPVLRKSYRLLYSLYVSHVTDAFYLGCDEKLSYLEKKDIATEKRLPIGCNRNPINLPDWWFDE